MPPTDKLLNFYLPALLNAAKNLPDPSVIVCSPSATASTFRQHTISIFTALRTKQLDPTLEDFAELYSILTKYNFSITARTLSSEKVEISLKGKTFPAAVSFKTSAEGPRLDLKLFNSAAIPFSLPIFNALVLLKEYNILGSGEIIFTGVKFAEVEHFNSNFNGEGELVCCAIMDHTENSIKIIS